MSSTALHLAAAYGQLDMMSYLITHRHALWVRDRWNATPLDEAQRHGHDESVKYLKNLM